MSIETKLVRVRDVFTENQRTSINRFFKKYGLSFKKKKIDIKRCDMRKISKNCQYLCLKDIDFLIAKVETKYKETQNIATRDSISSLKKMKKDIELFVVYRAAYELFY